MSRPAKTKVRLVAGGVDIMCDGEMIAGVTERDAVALYESLKRNMKKIKATIKKYDL